MKQIINVIEMREGWLGTSNFECSGIFFVDSHNKTIKIIRACSNFVVLSYSTAVQLPDASLGISVLSRS